MAIKCLLTEFEQFSMRKGSLKIENPIGGPHTVTHTFYTQFAQTQREDNYYFLNLVLNHPSKSIPRWDSQINL